jgi:hypothetical protein
MKKIFNVLLILIALQSCYSKSFFNTWGYRQPESQQREVEVYAGAGKTTITDPSPEETSYVDPVGVQFGADIPVFAINKKSFINSGLNFSFQGADYVDPGISGTVNLIYLNVPFLYTYDFNKVFYAEAGLQPGYLISAKDKYNGVTDNYRDYVNKFELGLPIGGGYRLNEKISFGVRGTYGLTKINNSGDGNDHNLLIVALVRYNLALPQK